MGIERENVLFEPCFQEGSTPAGRHFRDALLEFANGHDRQEYFVPRQRGELFDC
jgi:hypothetical protein